MRKRLPTLTLLLSLAVPLPLAAQDAAVAGESSRPVVAVIDFSAFSLTLQDASAVGKGVAGMIITELIDHPSVKVVERQELKSIIEEAKLSLSGAVDESSALEVGRLVGAKYLMTGSISMDASKVRMDVRVFEVETSEILKAMKETAQLDEMMELVVAITDRFMRELDFPTPKRDLIAQIPAPAILAYSRGEAYEENGELEQAREQYQKALELAGGGYSAADRALQRVNAATGADR